jgi:hypothetical protein
MAISVTDKIVLDETVSTLPSKIDSSTKDFEKSVEQVKPEVKPELKPAISSPITPLETPKTPSDPVVDSLKGNINSVNFTVPPLDSNAPATTNVTSSADVSTPAPATATAAAPTASVTEKSRGNISDANGNDKIDTRDLMSRKPMTNAEIGKELAHSDAPIVLVGESHQQAPDDVMAEAIKEAKRDGKYVAYGFELADEGELGDATRAYINNDIDEATYRERAAKGIGDQLDQRTENYLNVTGQEAPKLTPEEQKQQAEAGKIQTTGLANRIINARNAGADEVILYDSNNSINRDKFMENALEKRYNELSEEQPDNFKMMISTGASHARKEGNPEQPATFVGVWADNRDPLAERLEKALGDDKVESSAVLAPTSMETSVANGLKHSQYDSVYVYNGSNPQFETANASNTQVAA